jgi:CxxC-x17-CxxC domain-containing protein
MRGYQSPAHVVNRILPYSGLRAEQGRENGSASPMEYQDKVLKCIDCGTEFVFTAGEQLFFHDKQFKNEPKRCKNCKGKRVSVVGAASHASSSRGHSYAKTETRTKCSQCGKDTTVPFRPTQGRPVLCRECFQQGRQVASA